MESQERRSLQYGKYADLSKFTQHKVANLNNLLKIELATADVRG